jgi:hypothetical protein
MLAPTPTTFFFEGLCGSGKSRERKAGLLAGAGLENPVNAPPNRENYVLGGKRRPKCEPGKVGWEEWVAGPALACDIIRLAACV